METRGTGRSVEEARKQREAIILRLHAEGLDGARIAEILGVTRNCVNQYLQRKGITGKQYGYVTNISSWQEAILLGTMMGDGCLRRAQPQHNAQLKLCHCEKQLNYMLWKVEQLREFYTDTVTPNRFISSGIAPGHVEFEIRSRSHPILTEYHKLFYPNGRKVVSDEILTRIATHDFMPAIMAVWYMDDGATNQGAARFVIGNCNDDEYERLTHWFNTSGWQGAWYKNTGNCKNWGMRREASRRFFEMTAPYFHEDMRYKIPY